MLVQWRELFPWKILSGNIGKILYENTVIKLLGNLRPIGKMSNDPKLQKLKVLILECWFVIMVQVSVKIPEYFKTKIFDYKKPI